jgi:hypothetical protein
MILFVLRTGHHYTVKALQGLDGGVAVEAMDYRVLLGAGELPRATYIFGDLDRIPLYWLRLAAQVWRRLQDRGFTVLNDPARVLSRYGLLRRLHAAGFNRFNAYRVEDQPMPARWPVFLRCEGDHLGPVSDLLHSGDGLQREIDRAVAGGLPLASLLIIEFAAEQTRPGPFRKLSCFRIGRARFAHTCVHDASWVAKTGVRGIAPPELYEDEHRIVRDDPYGTAIAPAFDIAGVDYGRADFGLVGGRPQLYEINTNPDIGFEEEHPVALRRSSHGLFRANYLSALRAIDTPAG